MNISNETKNSEYLQTFVRPFLAGACAGLAVDISLFPIDTIKTRLQSPNGFWKSGGFSRIYLGIGSTVSGSAPGAALFFMTYELTQKFTKKHLLPDKNYEPVCNMISASFGEIIACLVRVPVEVVKQRAQTYHSNSLTVFRETLSQSGFRGLYRGYSITIFREIPFSLIQFPLWELLKLRWSTYQGSPIQAYQAMICGSFAGGLAAFLTTPLDVIKTQIMLQNFRQTSAPSGGSQTVATFSSNYFATINSLYRNKGIPGFFAGAIPRVIWISIGGAIFLGGYTKISSLLALN